MNRAGRMSEGTLPYDTVPRARLDAGRGVTVTGSRDPSARDGPKTMTAGKELPS